MRDTVPYVMLFFQHPTDVTECECWFVDAALLDSTDLADDLCRAGPGCGYGVHHGDDERERILGNVLAELQDMRRGAPDRVHCGNGLGDGCWMRVPTGGSVTRMECYVCKTYM